MKLKYISLVLACLTLMACNDEFLEQVPQDELSLATPWTQNLMEQYSNEYYKVVKGHTTGWGFGKAKSYIYEDEQSDNMARASVDLVAAGLHSVPDKDGGWVKPATGNNYVVVTSFLKVWLTHPKAIP